MNLKKRLKSWFLKLVFACVCLLSLEIAAQLAYRVTKGRWYWSDRQKSARGMMQLHPFFGMSSVPNASENRNGVVIHHNSFGFRGPEFTRPNPRTRTRIATLGGSTTYCVSVSDGSTWQDFLGKQLGGQYEVLNMGSPGSGTSIETMIESALLFSDVQPDIAIFHLGWNDARVQHVEDLRGDWVNLYGPWVLSFASSANGMEERTALGYMLKRALVRFVFPRMNGDQTIRNLRHTPEALTDQIDPRALGHYERNLRIIVAVCRKQGVEPVFVPQILNYPVLTSDRPYGWLPFVRDRDLKAVMAAYNATMAKVAREENVLIVDDVLKPDYGAADFVDNGHFSPSGHEKFARALAPKIAGVKLPVPPRPPPVSP